MLTSLDLQLAVLGLAVGAAYALSAVGLVVIYKGSGVLNFGHGAVGMIGTYVYVTCAQNWPGARLGAVFGVLTSAVVGLLIHVGVMRPLRRAPALAKLVASFGVLLVLQGAALLIWGDAIPHVDDLFSTDLVTVKDVSITYAQIWTVAIAIAIAILFMLFFARTTTGKATEAAAIDEVTALRLGYRVEHLAALTWALGSASAAVAGILIAPNIGLTQTFLTLIVIQALAGALVGGFNQVGLAVLTSFGIGVVQSVLTAHVDTPGLKDSIPFFVIAGVMLVRGRGILPRQSVVHVRLPAAPYPRVNPVMVGGAIAMSIVSPMLLSDYWRSVAAIGTAYAVVVLGLAVVTGYLGQVTLAQWSLAGFGAFVAGDLITNHGWSPLLATLGALLVGFGAGVIIGFPALRVRGINLSIVTLGAAVAVQQLVLNRIWGQNGLTYPPPSIFGVTVDLEAWLYVCLTILTLVAACVWLLRRSRFGQRLVAIRASERAAAAAGISVGTYKLIAFGLSSVMAALGGIMWAYTVQTINGDSFDVLTSIQLLALAFVNGIAVVAGAVVAGLTVGLIPPFLSEILHVPGQSWFAIIGGAGLIVALIRHPDGIFILHRRGSAGPARLRGVRGQGIAHPAADLGDQLTVEPEGESLVGGGAIPRSSI